MKQRSFLLTCLCCFWLVSATAETTQKNGDINGGENAVINEVKGNATIIFNSKEATDNSVDEWKFIDRYQVKGGLVKDPITGLMWMRCSIGQNWDGATCTGKAAKMEWEQAMVIPKNFDYAGFSDWRVPNKDELKTLVYCSSGLQTIEHDDSWECAGDYARPTIMQEAFPNMHSQDWFWSSSRHASLIDYRWFVNFYSGGDYDGGKYDKGLVRLVRGGQ